MKRLWIQPIVSSIVSYEKLGLKVFLIFSSLNVGTYCSLRAILLLFYCVKFELHIFCTLGGKGYDYDQ